jgi:hypothetical protein
VRISGACWLFSLRPLAMLTARGTRLVRVALNTRGASKLHWGHGAGSLERCMGRVSSKRPCSEQSYSYNGMLVSIRGRNDRGVKGVRGGMPRALGRRQAELSARRALPDASLALQ